MTFMKARKKAKPKPSAKWLRLCFWMEILSRKSCVFLSFLKKMSLRLKRNLRNNLRKVFTSTGGKHVRPS